MTEDDQAFQRELDTVEDPNADNIPSSNTPSIRDHLEHPNVQAYLGAVADAHGTSAADNPYAAMPSGGTLDDLSQHPFAGLFDDDDEDEDQQKGTAAGAYALPKPAWNQAQEALGLQDFGPQSQDLAAVHTMQQSGSLDDVINGDFQAAALKDAGTWPGLMAPSAQGAPQAPQGAPARPHAAAAQQAQQLQAARQTALTASRAAPTLPGLAAAQAAQKALGPLQRAKAAQLASKYARA